MNIQISPNNLDTSQNNLPAAQNNSTSIEAFLQSVESTVSAETADSRVALETKTAQNANWFDAVPSTFTAAQRAHTTILHAGLTMAHDLFIQSAFRGLGYKVHAMDVPDNDALQVGREFGNRGQCNPTYFTVGNLVKQLKTMEASGMTKQHIIENYLFATAGSCGPCRFGTYVTEYRKALRDSGFEGFRVIMFQQAGGMKQAAGEDMGLKIDTEFFLTMSKAIVLGDVLNALTYRIRPYEIEAGRTDAVIKNAKQRIAIAFETRKGLLKALWQTRKEIAAIKVDRTQVKPKVAIIGEFWAMTTEGDGNYKMHRFLEQEGAEVDIQLVVNWGLYLLWGAKFDTKLRMQLKGTDKGGPEGSKFALENVNAGKKIWMLRAAETFMRGLFYSYAKLLGLRDYHLPDMEHIAKISHAFYDNNLRGGEGHMEVGKLIHNVVDQKVNMTLSIKPFGCMPSSAVSDGVQSLITEMYPAAIFLPIETNGDGAVNVYSRVQMQLFKAKQMAERELTEGLFELSLSASEFKQQVVESPKFSSASYRSPHAGACTALDVLADIREHQKPWLARKATSFTNAFKRSAHQHKQNTLLAVERAATSFKQRKQPSAEAVVKFVEV
jgi:predicted nucleotide-binding protein (sugar kinase/HSP70/actin superfamily)